MKSTIRKWLRPYADEALCDDYLDLADELQAERDATAYYEHRLGDTLLELYAARDDVKRLRRTVDRLQAELDAEKAHHLRSREQARALLSSGQPADRDSGRVSLGLTSIVGVWVAVGLHVVTGSGWFTLAAFALAFLSLWAYRHVLADDFLYDREPYDPDDVITFTWRLNRDQIENVEVTERSIHVDWEPPFQAWLDEQGADPADYHAVDLSHDPGEHTPFDLRRVDL